jgi:hypothetical protein
MSETCPFEIDPYKISNDPNLPSAVNLNYTNQDFWSMKSRLISFSQQNFADKFNDFVESSIAVMLIENWAFIADTLSFKIDQIANEIFIDTVTELANAFRLAQLVGYKPTPPIASKCLWTARMNTTQNINIEIQTPFDVTLVNNDAPINYELFAADDFNRPIYDQPIIINAGKLTNSNVVGLEGQTYNDTFLGTGLINQSYLLTNLPVLDDSIRIDVDGERWKKVEFFTDSTPRKEYRVEYNSNYSLSLVFGNNRAGLSPALNSNISVTYRVGGGPQGNIVSNAASVDTLVNIPGETASVSVNFSNYTKGENGSPGDTVDEIRRKLPMYLKSQERAVTGEDYKNLTNLFVTPYNGSTGKANAVLRHSGCSANIIDLYVLTRDGTNNLTISSSQFKAELNDYISSKKMITDNICIKDGVVIDVEVKINVNIDSFYISQEDTIRSKILRNLDIFFNLQNWDYGKPLKIVDIIKSLSNIPEPTSYDISLYTVNFPQGANVINVNYYEIVRPNGAIDISFSRVS